MPGRGRGQYLKDIKERKLAESFKNLQVNGNNNIKTKVTIKTTPEQNKNGKPSAEAKLEIKKKVVPNANKYIAKYSYKANPDSPAGFKEINLKQGEEVIFLEKHEEQTHWCRIKLHGEEGYVPFSYLYCNEVTSLPWLRSSKEENEEPETQKKYEFKAYKSAYAKADPVKQEEDPDAYVCNICNKKLNGPVPYRAHIRSRAHKEEMEAAKEYGRI